MSAKLPPMQKPMTSMRCGSAKGCSWRYFAAAFKSCSAAWEESDSISLAASFGSFVALEPSREYRSGASAAKPARANRWAMSLMWSSSPHHSWITMMAGACPFTAAGRAKNALMVNWSLVNCTVPVSSSATDVMQDLRKRFGHAGKDRRVAQSVAAPLGPTQLHDEVEKILRLVGFK